MSAPEILQTKIFQAPNKNKILSLSVKNDDMHLKLGFQGSNERFGISLAAYLRHKNHQKNALEQPASWRQTFSTSSGFRGHLGDQHDTQNLTKTPQHSSRGHPRASQEPCQTVQEPCKTTLNTRPERPRPPRTIKISKMASKSRWGTPPALVCGTNMGAFQACYSATMLPL